MCPQQAQEVPEFNKTLTIYSSRHSIKPMDGPHLNLPASGTRMTQGTNSLEIARMSATISCIPQWWA